MDWELILVAGMILLATIYIAYSSWDTWFGKKTGCGGSCDCSKGSEQSGQESPPKESFIPLENLQLRQSDKKGL